MSDSERRSEATPRVGSPCSRYAYGWLSHRHWHHVVDWGPRCTDCCGEVLRMPEEGWNEDERWTGGLRASRGRWNTEGASGRRELSVVGSVHPSRNLIMRFGEIWTSMIRISEFGLHTEYHLPALMFVLLSEFLMRDFLVCSDCIFIFTIVAMLSESQLLLSSCM
jgi:hypothetical protein